MPNATSLNIVHLVRSPIGGIFRHIADLIVAQAAAGHRVGLVCDSGTGGVFEADKIGSLAPSLTLGSFRLPIARQIAPSDICALRRVKATLQPLAPDVVHAHGAKGGVFGRAVGTLLGREKPVARIYAPHGGSLHYDKRSIEGRVYFAIERAFERATDAIVHVSGYEERAYLGKVGRPRCRTAVIRNGLRPEEFALSVPANDAADFLYMGVLRDLKGVDVFIEALARLKDQGRPASATILGEGEDEARYRTMVAERGLGDLVRFMPSTPTRRAFEQGRAIVVPSRAESMPYIVLEAIAAGLPMVATNVGGIPEIFGPFAHELVAPSDPEALSQAMGAIAADPSDAARAAARRRAHIGDEFSITQMSSRIEFVYRASIESRHNGRHPSP